MYAMIYIFAAVVLLIGSWLVLYPCYVHTYSRIKTKISVLNINKAAQTMDYVTVFDNIYSGEHWGKGYGSGVGSAPIHAKQYIELLQNYFNDHKFKKIVDLGCGDWQIMSNIVINEDQSYIGYDVAKNIIAINNKKFVKPNVHFVHVHSLRDFAALNISGDLLIVKDVLQHWPNAEIEYFLSNILPNFKYALITNEYLINSNTHNADILLGGFRSLSLTDMPFNLSNAMPVLEYYGPGLKQVLLYINPN